MLVLWLGCGEDPSVLASSQSPCGELIIDATHAYWINGCTEPDRTLLRVPKGGGETRQVLKEVPVGAPPVSDGSFLYFSDYIHYSVDRYPVQGGPAQN